MKQFFMVCTMVSTLASCSMLKQTSNTSKTLGIYGAGVVQKPVLTHLKVNPQKFTSKYSASGTQGVEYYKSQAVAKAMAENKADVIIEPAYEITSSGTEFLIVLTGYAGSYENFRQISPADTTLLTAGIINYNDGPGQTPIATVEKKKGKLGWIVVGALLLGAAAVGGGL